ncbi:YceI family protein [Chitinophaga solisilvae]|uniref:YceI family protein n=1 Tax=Chitinophaga solisilvae TaxID=1233460 RepID=A0A9Q5DDI1_9BACT|nr:YceI family protein [Chitinophaga solisilvae]NSL89852.1 YceI family protein [Chitinophaga solisilvae]
MKQFLSILWLAAIGLYSCEQAPRADKATVSEAQAVQAGSGTAYLVDTSNSVVGWTGTKPTGKHHGTLDLTGGVIYVKDSVITGGQFIINMRSLQNIDLAADTAMKNKFESELKGKLFFDTEQYPAATFEITGVKPFRPAPGEEIELKDATHTIFGNLTLKAVTKNISFPARISISGHELNAAANFNIDRTVWGISYRADKSVQDKLINSQVNIRFQVKATR